MSDLHRHDVEPHGHHGGMAHDFSDAEAWAARFDAPEREAWQRPDAVVELLALREGMVVVDLGAGTGYFGARLSRAVGPSGRVLALDVETNMVEHIRRRAAREGLANVEARLCSTDSTGLPPASVDRVLIVDTWHHLGDRAAYASHLASVLGPQGSVVVVDYTLDAERGPPRELRLSAEQVIAELAGAGLVGAVLGQSLPDQYVVSGVKP